MMTALLVLLAMGVLGVVTIAMLFTVVAMIFGMVGFLLFKVLPVVLIGWVVLKLVERGRSSPRRISAADQRWLDGE